MQVGLQPYRTTQVTPDCWPVQHRALSRQLVFKLVLNKKKKKQRKTVTCSQPQFHPGTNRLEALAEATESQNRNLQVRFLELAPLFTPPPLSHQGNSFQRWASVKQHLIMEVHLPCQFCFEKHRCTSRVISMKMKVFPDSSSRSLPVYKDVFLGC